MEVHKIVFDMDMWGNIVCEDVTETVYYDEWADFDD